MNIIEVKELTKKYNDFTAVDGISFDVKTGECFGILGPNGAGKTTTLEMIEGLKNITSGNVILDGHDVGTNIRYVKSVIGVQLQASAFFDNLNLKELIDVFASLYGRTVNAMELLEAVDLEDKYKNQAKELSGGQKQRLSIAVAMVNQPKVLFLDEPTTGLDPQARRNLWDLVNKIKAQGTTIVLTTHYMEEAQILCDRVAIMDHAKIIALDTPANLIAQTGLKSAVAFSVNKPLDSIRLQELDAVETVHNQELNYTIATNNSQKTLADLFHYLNDAAVEVSDLKLTQPDLEDVFLKLTGHSLRE